MLKDVIVSVVKNLGIVEGRVKLVKLLFLVDYEAGKNVTGVDWVYHYYGPYSGEIFAVLEELVDEGVIAEGYDDENGLYLYSFLGGNYDSSVDVFVRPVVEKYGKFSGGELKELSYKLLEKMGVSPGERIVI